MESNKNQIKEYMLSPEAMVMVAGSSKGTQTKYYSGGYWYKKNSLGYEGLAEELVTEALKCSNADYFAVYEQCVMNGSAGCRSKNFLSEGESLISFQRLYSIFANDGELSGRIRLFNDVEDRIDFVLDFIYESIGLDVKPYLAQILTLDMLTLNDDRHLNNLALIADVKNNTYKPAPIYDNGGALLSAYMKYPPDVTIEENIEKVIAQPFSINAEFQARCLGFNLKIDYDSLYKKLEEYPNSRAKEVFMLQLKRYENELKM